MQDGEDEGHTEEGEASGIFNPPSVLASVGDPNHSSLASVSKIDEKQLINSDEWRKRLQDTDNPTDQQGRPLRVLSAQYADEKDHAIISKEIMEDEQERRDIKYLADMIDNTNYDRLPKMRNLDADRLKTTEYLAKALSDQEILDYFGIVDPLVSWEKNFFKLAVQKGRSMGKKEAMEKLFISMGDRNGGVQALNYLVTHAERFPSAGEDALKGKSGGFQFNVKLD